MQFCAWLTFTYFWSFLAVLAQALLELNPQSYSTQNIEEVPYISLDEFLSSDSEEIKTTSKHNQGKGPFIYYVNKSKD